MSFFNLISGAGLLLLPFLAWIFSENRRVINWRVIGWGIALQLLFACFVFVIPAGTKIFLVINKAVVPAQNFFLAASLSPREPLMKQEKHPSDISWLFKPYPPLFFSRLSSMPSTTSK